MRSVRLDFETSDPADGIRTTFSDGRRAYMSAKRKIDQGCPHERTLAGWVRQVPILGPDDLPVIVGKELTGPVKNLNHALRRHRAGLSMETSNKARALTLLTDRLPSPFRRLILDRARVLRLSASTGPAAHQDLLVAPIIAGARGHRAVSPLTDTVRSSSALKISSSSRLAVVGTFGRSRVSRRLPALRI